MDEGTVSRFGDGYGPSSTCGWVLTCSDTDANPTLTIDTIAMADDGDQLAVFDGVDNNGDQLLPGGPTNVIQAGMDAITPGPPVAESCNAHFLGGATADGFYLVSPPGWQDDPFEMYCAGGWALVATIGAPQNLVYLGDHIADGAWEPGGSEVKAHPQYAAVTGESMRVGQLVAIGTNTGNIQEINDCTAGDAACLWSHGINQNDGDQYGNWVRHGGQWQHDPGGSTDQASVAAGADLLCVVACTYVPTLSENRSERRQKDGRAQPPAWLGAVAHAARHGVFVAYCNQAKGMGVVRAESSQDGEGGGGRGGGGGGAGHAKGDVGATCQGGCSRVLAPDGRDVVAVPEGARDALVYAVLGQGTRARLAWSGSALADTLEVAFGSGLA